MRTVKIVGGGLAGVEAANQLLERGFSVELYEMRPKKNTPAHKTELLAELVCSNSLKSDTPFTAQWALKEEMRMLSSLTLRFADEAKVPSGGALAVDREIFSKKITDFLLKNPNFKLINEEVVEVESFSIICSGPLTSSKLADRIKEITGDKNLSFFDAAAPIVTFESIDKNSAFFASRYQKGTDDYLNCPLTKQEYLDFHANLVAGATVIRKDFEKGDLFEACLPIEEMAKRGLDTLRFGTLRPVGIRDKNGDKFYAIVQLRQEDKEGKLFNLVGFQTNLTFLEQKRIFSLIPALKNAEFVRYGVMHKNTFINSPEVLSEFSSLKTEQNIFFAGQITGVEGYMESAASGILAGLNMARILNNKLPIVPPNDTMIGSLMRYINTKNKDFQPMHVSFSLLPPLENPPKNKDERKKLYAERAIESMKNMLNNQN